MDCNNLRPLTGRTDESSSWELTDALCLKLHETGRYQTELHHNHKCDGLCVIGTQHALIRQVAMWERLQAVERDAAGASEIAPTSLQNR